MIGESRAARAETKGSVQTLEQMAQELDMLPGTLRYLFEHVTWETDLTVAHENK